MEILEGLVEAIVFKSDDSGYTVAKITTDKKVITIVGIMPLLKEGQQIEIKGNWINHKQFGKQFNVEEFKEILPTSVKEIEKYFSGLEAVKWLQDTKICKCLHKWDNTHIIALIAYILGKIFSVASWLCM